MYSFGGFLQELSINTGIDFNLIDEDGNKIYHSNLKVENSQCMSYLITLGNGKQICVFTKTMRFAHLC